MIERVGHERLGDGPELRPAWLTLKQAAKLTGISEFDLRWLGYFHKVPCLRGKRAQPLMICHQEALELRGKKVAWQRVPCGGRRGRTLPVPMVEDEESPRCR